VAYIILKEATGAGMFSVEDNELVTSYTMNGGAGIFVIQAIEDRWVIANNRYNV
jgi:hypothetical protein